MTPRWSVVPVLACLAGCTFSPSGSGSDRDGAPEERDGSPDAPPDADTTIPWADEAWLHRKAITIQAAMVTAPPEGLQSFPVALIADDPDISAAARGDGRDLFFTASDGTSRLDHELEFYQSGQFVAWVRLPELTGDADTRLYVYYGNQQAQDQANPPQVWIANHAMVLHLDEDPTSGTQAAITDSSGRENHATAENSMNRDDRIPARLGRGYELDGADDYLTAGNLQLGERFTLSMWVLPEPGPGDNIEPLFANSLAGANMDGMRFFYNRFNTTDGALIFEAGNDNATGACISGTGLVQAGQWNFFAAVVDRPAGTAIVYHNDGPVATSQEILTDFRTDAELEFGRMRDFQFHLAGIIDEIVVASVVRGPEWLATTYANQSAPDVFAPLGGEEDAPQ